MKEIVSKFTSRKFLATLLSALLPIVAPLLNVPPELVKWAQGALMLYVGTEGAIDAVAANQIKEIRKEPATP